MNVISPIKSIDEINLIKDLFQRKKQIPELVMFTLAINTGIELSDLLNLKIKDVKNKFYLHIDKKKVIQLNEETRKLLANYTTGKLNSDFLFKNKKDKKLDRTTVFYSFKEICSELGLNGRYSVASWRKTFAYHYYKKYKDLSFLMWLFNQNSIERALSFIGETENMNLRFKEGVNL